MSDRSRSIKGDGRVRRNVEPDAEVSRVVRPIGDYGRVPIVRIRPTPPPPLCPKNTLPHPPPPHQKEPTPPPPAPRRPKKRTPTPFRSRAKPRKLSGECADYRRFPPSDAKAACAAACR